MTAGLLGTTKVVVDLLHIREKNRTVCKGDKLSIVNLEHWLIYQKVRYRTGIRLEGEQGKRRESYHAALEKGFFFLFLSMCSIFFTSRVT